MIKEILTVSLLWMGIVPSHVNVLLDKCCNLIPIYIFSTSWKFFWSSLFIVHGPSWGIWGLLFFPCLNNWRLLQSCWWRGNAWVAAACLKLSSCKKASCQLMNSGMFSCWLMSVLLSSPLEFLYIITMFLSSELVVLFCTSKWCNIDW